MAGNELKKELDIDGDLKYLVNDLSNAKHKAIDLAVQLGIKKATRDAIASSTKDAGDMLRKVLEEFLQGNGSELITRESIIRALESGSVELPLIAQEMRQKYSTSPTDSSGDAPETPSTKHAAEVISNDSGFDSSVDPPETPNTENRAEERPCPAPTGEMQKYCVLFNDAILECRLSYAKSLKGIRNTCESVIGHQEIKKITHDATNYPLQLKTGMSSAQSWDDVWHYLDTYTGWENSRPIEMLVKEKGSKKDEENLSEFLHKREWFLEVLKMKYDERMKELVLKLDEDYDEFKCENIEVVQLRLCCLLRCLVTWLKVERGCVKITVAIPAETAEDVFPLSPTMREEFQRAFPSIISVTCGKIKEPFANTHYSKEEGRESQDKDVGIESHDEEESDDEEDYFADESESDENFVEEQVTTKLQHQTAPKAPTQKLQNNMRIGTPVRVLVGLMILTLLAIQGPALNRGIFARNFDGTLNEYYASDGTLNEYYASDGTLNEYYASDGTLNEYYASDGPFNANFNRNFGCPAINVTIGNKLKRQLDGHDLMHLVNDLSEARHKAKVLTIQLGIKEVTRKAPKAASSPQESVISNDSGFGSFGSESKSDSSEDAGASETPTYITTSLSRHAAKGRPCHVLTCALLKLDYNITDDCRPVWLNFIKALVMFKYKVDSGCLSAFPADHPISVKHQAAKLCCTSSNMYLKCTFTGSAGWEIDDTHKAWLQDQNTCKIYERPTLPGLLAFKLDSKRISLPEEIGKRCLELRPHLLQDTTGTITKSIEHQFARDAFEMNYEILRRWLQGQGRDPVTWATLIEALRNSRLIFLAEDVKKQST